MRITKFVSTLAIVLTMSLSANAQKTQDDPRKAEATKLYQEGIDLHDKKMEAEALKKYEEAYAIYPSPNILFNVARQEHLLGKRLAAIRHYREAMRNPMLPPPTIELGKKYVAELEPSFARLDLIGPTGLVVSLGGEEVRLPLPEPLDIEPGQVMATGALRGQRYEGSGKAVPGQLLTIEMKAPGPRVEPSREAERGYWTGEHVAGIALGGLAVVAAGVGVGFLAARSGHVADQRSSASDICTVPASNSCRQFDDAHDRAKTAAIVSGVSFGVVVVAGVTAGYLLWPKRKESARVHARVLPTGQGILIDGAF